MEAASQSNLDLQAGGGCWRRAGCVTTRPPPAQCLGHLLPLPPLRYATANNTGLEDSVWLSWGPFGMFIYMHVFGLVRLQVWCVEKTLSKWGSHIGLPKEHLKQGGAGELSEPFLTTRCPRWLLANSAGPTLNKLLKHGA